MLVVKLRDRLDQSKRQSPDGFKRSVSDALEVPVEVLTAHLEASQTANTGKPPVLQGRPIAPSKVGARASLMP